MKMLVINPNTSIEMTEDIERTIAKVKDDDVQTIVTMPDFGPVSLESFYDYSLATFGSIREINKYKNVDGILIACFGDPGIYALKERYNCLTIGIAEASMSTALLMGKKFSLLVASEKAVPMMEDMVNQYGLLNRLSSIENIGMKVLDIEKDKEKSVNQLVSVGNAAIKKRRGSDFRVCRHDIFERRCRKNTRSTYY